MTRIKGLTLVEVMIAMLLVLIASAGALALVARGRAAQRTGETVATLEEITDAAFAILVEELHIAGYLGLAAPGKKQDALRGRLRADEGGKVAFGPQVSAKPN